MLSVKFGGFHQFAAIGNVNLIGHQPDARILYKLPQHDGLLFLGNAAHVRQIVGRKVELMICVFSERNAVFFELQSEHVEQFEHGVAQLRVCKLARH